MNHGKRASDFVAHGNMIGTSKDRHISSSSSSSSVNFNNNNICNIIDTSKETSYKQSKDGSKDGQTSSSSSSSLHRTSPEQHRQNNISRNHLQNNISRNHLQTQHSYEQNNENTENTDKIARTNHAARAPMDESIDGTESMAKVSFSFLFFCLHSSTVGS